MRNLDLCSENKNQFYRVFIYLLMHLYSQKYSNLYFPICYDTFKNERKFREKNK